MSSVSSSKRTMHALGEAMEPEEVLSANAPSTCSHVQRPRTSSSASDAAVLRNEVVDLLLLARKASATPTFSCTSAMAASTSSGSSFSSSSISPTSQEAHADIAKCSSSASARDPALSYGVKVNEHGRYVGKGTASKDQLEELARAVSPPPPHTTTVVQGKTKKKFGLFGGNNSAGKEGDNAASASPVLSQSPDMKPASTVRVPMRAQSPLPPRGASTAGGSSSRAQYAMQMTSFKAGPPVSGTHRNPMAAQHRRKRSMSVGDASAFFPTTSSSSKVQTQAHANARCRVRPDVYDESYFSNLKTPFYCTASLGESQQHSKRANQLARLGIVEDAEVGPVGDDEESLSVAKERLLAQARTAVGHPSPTSQAQAPARAQYKDSSKEQYAVYAHNVRMDNPPSAAASFASASSAATAASQSTLSSGESQKSQKRQGQLVLQGETSGSFHLTAANRPPAQVTWTSPAQSQQQQQPEPRSARSNSDASILDPFLPGGGNASKNSNSKRPTHLVVPSLSPGLTAHIPDSVAAIGPPPASPLPSPPSAPSGRASPSVKELRAPSPSQQMILPPARSPAPTSPLPPLPAAVCPAPVQRALQASSPSPPQPTRSPPAVPLSENGEKTEYDFELRPHRTKQQGRPRLSPLHERERTSPPESPALDKMMAVPPRPFGTRGIVQRPPSALNMNLLPSPAPPPPMTSTTATMMTSSSPSSSNSLSSGSAPTPKARDFDHAQLRRRQETATTFASQYSTEGEFEGYDASRSSGSSGISSSSTNATGNFKQPSGSNGHSGSSAGHTTLSSTPSYSSSSSMTSYNSSASRPSLTMSMDGSSTEDDHSSVSTHHSNNGRRGQEGYGYVHVNMAVPMKPPRKGMTASPSCESVNNLAGIGLAKGQYQYPHSRRMHFGWSRHKAMLDLAGHIGEEAASPYDFNEGNGKEEVSSPGSEDDAYAGILGAYDTQRAKTGPSHSHDDEGYIGSSPEMVSSQAELSKSGESELFPFNRRKPV